MSPEVSHSGIMYKKGPHFKASYKKRYFELSENKLTYYEDHNTNKKPKGQIQLEGAQLDLSGVAKMKLKIATKERKYYLKTETVSEFERWAASLEKAIKSQQQNGARAKQMREEISNARKSSILVYQSDRSRSLNLKKKVSLDDFEVLLLLGRGSFGKVMKVKHKPTGKIYAMKTIKKNLVAEANFVESTKSENVILRTINHPFIASLHFAFQTEEKLFLVLEYLSGGELFFHLQKEKKFSEDKARFYVAEILLGLEHLHKNGIIYRDLKPENVVLDGSGHVVLTDFGLSKTDIHDNEQTYTFCGTPEYLAPEICRGDGYSKPADFWSLGIVTYALMTGSVPFYSQNLMQQYQLIMSHPIRYPDYLSSKAKSLLTGLLDRDPSRRFNADACKSHPFFEGIDWQKLEKKEIIPPFVPESTEDERYFDEGFTGEDINAESDDDESHSSTQTPGFEGFTFDPRTDGSYLKE
jgi:serine/threonine protein kinase